MNFEEFKKELDVLLMKYPDLPEFSLKVRPRVSFEIASEKKYVPPAPQKVLTPMIGETVLPPPSNAPFNLSEFSKTLE